MNNKQKKAIVLISGGMDSALTAAIAKCDGYVIAALHLNYGQRTELRELKAFNDLCNFYNVNEKLIIDMTHLAQIGGSSLTDTNIELSHADLKRKEIPTSYVAFRNANMLSIAVSWAEILKAKAIYIGAVEEDSSGYPDCRSTFFNEFQKAINAGTKPDTDIIIITPVIHLSKKDIVLKGIELNVPFHLTWSCYKESEFACGECDSCALRLRGFQQAGINDPLKYKIYHHQISDKK